MDEALDQAMLQFWRTGYGATSVRQLCEAMGIGSGSFYATFGSKDDLFRLVLRRYLAAMDLGTPGPDAIRRYLDRVVARRLPQGCLLVLSALELAALPSPSAAVVQGGLSALEDFLWRCLEGRSGARSAARHLAATVAGLQVMHRAGVDEAHLRQVADRSLEVLDLSPSVD